MPPLPPHLTPSPLGTKTYWTTTYAADLTQHATNPTHTGTTWFSDSLAEEKVLAFLASSGPALGVGKTSSVLDVGTGNGAMLARLRAEGWVGRLVGVDYAGEAVRLAREVVGRGVRFEEWDVMRDGVPAGEGGAEGEGSWFPAGGFDVVLDKGTFDAVSLSGEMDERGERVCEGYAERVRGLVRVGGVFVVTSCNWTEEELGEWLLKGEGGFEVVGRVRYPRFRFGGAEGQSVSSVVFRRKR